MFQIPQMFLPKMFQIPQMFGQTEEKYTDLWEAKLKILARKRTFSQKKSKRLRVYTLHNSKKAVTAD